MNRRLLPVLTVATAAAYVLTGCAATPSPTASEGTNIQVVASTNVYGSIAAQIGGDRVEVTSIITSLAQDPHSYEATARDRLAVQSADLLIENGGGYDHFMEQLREGLDIVVVTAVESSHDFPGDGHDDHDDNHHDDDHDDDQDHHGHNHIEGFNEHVWFDVHTMIHVVEEIADELTELDAAGAASYEAAADALIADLEKLEAQTKALREEFAGSAVFITEPLAGYLALALGLDDHTPEGFAESLEAGTEVSPAILLEAIELIQSGQLKALISNAQTGGAETDRVEAEAKSAGVTVVSFTELLPDAKTYAEWMQDAINSLADALRA